MNGYAIILIISLLMEVVILFGTLRYLKGFLSSNKLDELCNFHKEIEVKKDKQEIFNDEVNKSINSNRNTLALSIVATVYASYMNLGDNIVYFLGAILVLFSTVKYILIKRYIYDLSNKINFKNKEIEWF